LEREGNGENVALRFACQAIYTAFTKEAGPVRHEARNLEAGGTKKEAWLLMKEARPRPGCRKQSQGVRGQGPGARTGSRHTLFIAFLILF